MLIALAVGIFFTCCELLILAAKHEKDKTPPVITNLAVSAGTTTALVSWTTDEPADSDIDYGIDTLNQHGPRDTTLVLAHTISLANLIASTTYQYCVLSRDASNNKGESCGRFDTLTSTTTPPPPPPPPSPTTGGGGGARPTLAMISGFAYPGATVTLTLRPIFFGTTLERSVTAADDASFSASFSTFPQGMYVFSVSASDTHGASSAVKRFVYDFSSGDEPLTKEAVILPPTVTFVREEITRGDDIVVTGSTIPNAGVLVEAGDVSYEAKSDMNGQYKVAINTARFTPGKLSIRARSSVVSDFGKDFSPSKTVIIAATTAPQSDLNGDGVVTMADLSIFLAHPVDLNKDGKINAADVSIFLRAFSRTGR